MKDKIAILAVLGLAGVSAQAVPVANPYPNSVAGPLPTSYTPGDLLVGVYVPGSTTDYVIDIGTPGALVLSAPNCPTATETWNLSSDLTAAGITLTASDSFGVIGYVTTAHFATSFATVGTGNVTENIAPTIVSDQKAIGNALVNGVGSVSASAFNVSATGADVNQLVSTYPSLPANFGPEPGFYSELQSDTITANSPTLLGYFNLNYQTEVLSFVPEPATYGLLAGLGVLAVSLRRQPRRKTA